jgi:spore maturation protein CgeB
MKISFLVQSIASCWNNGNAHFQRGVICALQAGGHEVQVLEPAEGWSRTSLLAESDTALDDFAQAFPRLRPETYGTVDEALAALDAATPDLVVVHEWNDPALVNAIGRRRKGGGRFSLLFHDTHHRAISRPGELGRFDLSGYDGVLAFGFCLAEIYERRGWGRRVWTWHEAADTRLFRPHPGEEIDGDIVWIGNWGDEERSEELHRFLMRPAAELGLRGDIYGVRYPAEALHTISTHGLWYRGWLPNHRVPEVFARYRVTVHVPRRPYAEMLPGIPTIRVFEALACGIPLVSAPWIDSEGLFPEYAYLTARNTDEMERALSAILNEPDFADCLSRTGLQAILSQHTCDHRADELLAIHDSLAGHADSQLQRAG